jgi:NAD(P)-dependent dehydrogenase (short-subunit alcohol dehydrogenase family)
MARIFITGSADGLGQLAAKELIDQGHAVVLHARNSARGKQALDKLPGAEDVLTADLSDISETIALASKVNALGPFDAVIHNAGVYQVSNNLVFAVNTIAPYILTSLIKKKKRLIYLSSGMHLQGNPDLDNIISGIRNSNKYPTYSDTKLHDVILCLAVARKWREVYANAVDPGWVPTKMGGQGAPDNLVKGFQTQTWLAVSNDSEAKVSGHYFHHKREENYLPAAGDITVQEKFLAMCEQISGVHFPADHQ